MKTSGQCPKCACTKLYVVNGVRQPAQDSNNLIVALNVTCADVPSAEVGVADGNDYRAAIGHFDAWICSSCGLTEWYARNAKQALERFVELGQRTGRRVHVQVVEKPQPAPYR